MHRHAHFRRGFRLRARRAATLLGAGIVALAAAGLAAAQNDGEGLIHACVSKTGEVRIVGPSDACPKNQTALDWNRQGPQGLPGPQGPAGPQGEPGEPGAPALFATAKDQGTPAPNVLDESRTTPGVKLERLDKFGRYKVVFPRSLAGCAVVASLRRDGEVGTIDSSVLDDPDNTVRVNTAIEIADELFPHDLPFTVAVFC
jgi:hypothetical protein